LHSVTRFEVVIENPLYRLVLPSDFSDHLLAGLVFVTPEF